MFGPVTYDSDSGVWACDVDEHCRLVEETKDDLERAMDVVQGYLKASWEPQL